MPKLKTIVAHFKGSLEKLYQMAGIDIYRNIPKPSRGNILEPNLESIPEKGVGMVDAVTRLLGPYGGAKIKVEEGSTLLIVPKNPDYREKMKKILVDSGCFTVENGSSYIEATQNGRL